MRNEKNIQSWTNAILAALRSSGDVRRDINCELWPFILNIINNLGTTLDSVTKEVQKSEKLNKKFNNTIISIFFEGSQSLLAGIELIRCGYHLQAQPLARNAMEWLAIVITLIKYPDKTDEYSQGILEGQSEMRNPKSIWPFYGALYGSLSDLSHASYGKTGSYITWRPTKEGYRFAIRMGGELSHCNWPDLVRTIMTFEIISELFNATSGLITKKGDGWHKYWQARGDKIIWKLDAETKSKWDDYFNSLDIYDKHSKYLLEKTLKAYKL